MRSLAGASVGWLARLWQRSAPEAAARAGERVVRPVDQVIAALEARVCEGVVHRPASPVSAESARRMEPSGPPPRNVFGRPVQEEVGTGAPGSVAVATGMTLAGLRATAFLRGDELDSAHEALRSAAERLTPLVVHVANRDAGHAGYHGVSGSGLFQMLAASGQEALDLSLVARWVAERALVPAMVATDGITIEDLELPDDETVRAYLGPPEGSIASPTEAQRVLFGIERPRLVRWFDADRPVSTGSLRGGLEEARARIGGRLYFWDHVSSLARNGMDELSRLTGRRLAFVHRYALDDADAVLVVQGAGVQVARAVAEHLRRSRRWKLGVLGVSCLRPFPTQEVSEALEGRRAVAVVEAIDEPLAPEPPLFRELKGAVRSTEGWISATCGGAGPDPARLSGLCELLLRSDRPHRVQLDRLAAPGATRFPRRDALLQTLSNDYPALRDPGVAAGDPPAPDPAEGRSVGLVGLEALVPPDALERLAEAVAAECGPFVRGSASRPEVGVLQMQVRAARKDFSEPGPMAAVSLLIVATDRPGELGHALRWVAPGSSVLLSTDEEPERAWETLPPAWRRTVGERGLRLLTVARGLEAGLDAVRACLRGEEREHIEAGSLHEIAWRDLPPPDRLADEPHTPALVRRIQRTRAAHDSLPRFWGELLQPWQAGAVEGVSDPLEAAGVVPAGASALGPEPQAAVLPVLDAEACTGCGRCWTACPDAAIGVTAISTEALLTAASHAARTEGRAADAVRRAHKHLAGRLNGQLAKSDARVLTEEHCREGWAWLSGRMDLSEDERAEQQAALDATLVEAMRLPAVAARPFFHEAEEREKGTGELLFLAVDPRSCLGCGLCVSACPEDALEAVARTPERLSGFREQWRAWEALPDTSGGTLARAAEHADVGPMAAALLSRHCAQAQVGGAGEPGSGERLAGRLVAALVEQSSQRRMAHLVGTLDETGRRLEEKVRTQLADGLSATDLGTLAEAVGRVTPGRAALSDLGEQLRTLGAPATFDRRTVLRLVRLAGDVEQARHRVAEGEDGLGRARFGVVVARGTVAEWAGSFPHHPYYAPLTLAPTAQGVELARGIALGLVAAHLDLVRMLRRASLELEAPPDRRGRLEALAGLTWGELEAEDRRACAPLLLLGDDTALLEHGFDALTRLLASDLPVKVVLLDGRGRLGAGPEPALVAMAHRRAFVLCGSLAHSEHLARGVTDALAWPGPALIHLHAPSPSRHGFRVDRTLERARLAVEGRAHVLLRYDPAAPGLFGLRATLEGNPAPADDWGEVSFAAWAAGEDRFADHFVPLDEEGQDAARGLPLEEWLGLPEAGRATRLPTIKIDGSRRRLSDRMARATAERLAVWNVLRELTGGSSPFTERIRSALKEEVEAEQRARVHALEAEHAEKVTGLRSKADQEALDRLTERLMTLAGYPSRERPPGNGA